ncbi:MAG: thiamine pyrophosphate-binding protein [Alphaproteobacteria bacterium]
MADTTGGSAGAAATGGEGVRRSGGQLVVDALLAQGVTTVFTVPGESFLAVLDALHDAADHIRVITCRHEAGAANMAEAHGKLTGWPAACLVTRGPGACHAAVGVHTASQDSTPMLLLIGQVARDVRDREAFQEVDFTAMFGPLAKWAGEVREASRVGEYMRRAVQTAVSGRPGPVVLSLPEDMQNDAAPALRQSRVRPTQAAPTAAAMAELRQRLDDAEWPLLLLGGGTWSAAGVADIQAFAEANGLPVTTSFRAQDRFDNRHPNYAGHVGIAIDPALAQRVRDADLIIAAGPRLSEITTSGYTLLVPPRSRQTLIHIHPDADEPGRTYEPDLAIAAGMDAFAAAARAMEPVNGSEWLDWRGAARADYEASLKPGPFPGALDLGRVIQHLDATLPDDAIITNGAGNYATWVHRFFRYRGFGTQLAPTSGAMGYGVPAAIAAKAAFPDRVVVNISGDGCFMMSAAELATARQHGLDPVFLVVNNGMYGTIRMHQERHYPGRVVATDLINPDFAALAEAHGVLGQVVTETSQFPDAFERALNAGRAALIELRIDPDGITTRDTLSAIRRRALEAQA